MLRGATNPAAVGIFSAGVKYLDGLNVIPAYFTLGHLPADEPLRHAARGESLVKAYRLALQLLFMVALPIAVFFTFAATPLIQILGGAAYLPDSAIALRDHDLVHPDRLRQLGHAVRADRRQPAALPDPGLRHRGGLHRGGQPGARAALRLRGCGGHPDPGGAGALHPLRRGGAAPRRADAVVHPALRPLVAAAADAAVTWAAGGAGLPLPVALVAGGLTYWRGCWSCGSFPRRGFDAAARPHTPQELARRRPEGDPTCVSASSPAAATRPA